MGGDWGGELEVEEAGGIVARDKLNPPTLITGQRGGEKAVAFAVWRLRGPPRANRVP